MNRLIAISIVIVGASLCTAPSQAQTIDGNGYPELCTSGDAGLQNGCAGFGAGILSALMFWNQVRVEQGGPTAKFCIPPGVKTTQAVDVVLEYVKRHPRRDTNLPEYSPRWLC